MIRKLIVLAALLLPAFDFAADAPIPSSPDEIHQVMFLVTINLKTGVWTHSQVIGGYKDHDTCIHFAPMAGSIASTDLGPDELPIVLCPLIDIDGIKKHQSEADAPPAPPVINEVVPANPI
jgi:hypothetical protein